MHKSWSQLLLIMLVPSAQAVADNPIFYRVVVFNGVLHSNEPGSSVGQNLAIWPRVSAKGDGLRFRFCGEQTVIGTTLVSPSGLPTLGDLRGAAWRIGTTDLTTLLPLPAGAIGSVASDSNDDGSVVGGIIVSSGDTESVQAAAWSYSDANLSSEPVVTTAFQGIDLGICFDQPPTSLLTAVGPRDSTTGHKAMVAGTTAIVNDGQWNDGFFGAIAANGSISDVARLPGVTDMSWCASWGPMTGKRCAIVPCVAWDGAASPATWSNCIAIGSMRNTVLGPTVSCVDTQKWDFCCWTSVAQQQLIDHCRGCDGSTLDRCVSIGTNPTPIYEAVTDLRLGAFAPSCSALPAAYAGMIQVRSSTSEFGICNSNICPQPHAAVVTSNAPQDPSSMHLWDLHSVLQQGGSPSDGAGGSAIARILHQAHSVGIETVTWWLALGAVSTDPVQNNLSGPKNGYIWVGKAAASDATDWCAWNVNDIAIRPLGMVVESVHDMNDAGIGIAVVSSTQNGTSSLHLAYLTPVADLNGDLQVNGADLGMLLGEWGPVGTEGQRLYDLNQDGNINGADLGLFLGGWGDFTGPTTSWIGCGTQSWNRPVQRYGYIDKASELLGFATLDELGETARALTPDGQVGLCSVVEMLADALEGTQ